MSAKIAVIGLSGRFPDAPNLEKLTENLRLGIKSLRPISENRKKATTLPQDGNYHTRGYMEDVDCFDYKFFNISLGEAETMDPRQRLLLEVVYEAIENAGLDASTLEGTDTAVFATYSQLDYYKHAENFTPTLVTGNGPEFLAARINRAFNLNGCVSVIDTSCSSGLVAIHHACNEILAGNATQAIVCGASVELFPDKEDGYDVGIESADGKSVPFSKNANGMAFGEGVVAIMLKSYQEAIKDKDPIQAVILGSAVNSNAARSASLTAPDSQAQAEVLLKAWKKSEIDIENLAFIEAHGSGTLLGDSLEIGGLNLAFKSLTPKTYFCSISTIKSNIGHSRSVAGLAGLAKVILSLKNQEIYPSVYDNQPNPYINLNDSPVFIGTTLQKWEKSNSPRIAGVSSMGFSGTNCHIVLSEGVNERVETSESKQKLILLSAAQNETLAEVAKRLEEKIISTDDISISDLAFTLGSGRKKHDFRQAFLVNDTKDLIETLRGISSIQVSNTRKKSPKLIFVFGDEVVQNDSINKENPYEKVFLSQYHHYQNLRNRGIIPNKMIGYGVGKIVIEAITEKISFEEAQRKAQIYQPEVVSDLQSRTQILIDRETSSQFVGFVAITPENKIINQLSIHDKNEKNFSIIELNSVNESKILEAAQIFFLENYKINWQSFFIALGGNKIDLPTYPFAKTRCWIRETPKQKLIGQTMGIETRKGLIIEENYSITEEKIAELWAEVINLNQVSIHDNFFEVGGDSLKATKVITRINQNFGVRLDFEDFFDYPTLQKLSAFVDDSLPTQTKIANIWKSVLKNSDIQPNDDFFEIGGHSILANQIMMKVREYMAYSLNFDEFFQNPTISKLSAFIENKKNKHQSYEIRISKAPEAKYYNLTHAQKGLWVLSQVSDNSVAYNEFMAFELEGAVSIEAMKSAFKQIVERHESLRTNFVLIDGEPKQQIRESESSGFEVEILDFSTENNPEELTWNYATTFSNQVFNLEIDSLIRVSLVKLSTQNTVLLLNIHHIVFDEWSFKVLIQELMTFYHANIQNKSINLSPIDFQFKDFAHFSNTQLQSKEANDSKKYWQNQLSGNLEPLQLPTDLQQTNNRSFLGTTIEKHFDKETTRKIRNYAQANGLSLNMVLMSAIKVLLSRYSNQNDIVIGMPVATRNLSETEKLIGLFVNTLPIRTKIDGKQSFKELTTQLKTTLVEAYKHQQYPLALMVEDLVASKSDANPLFNVLVVHDKSNLRNQTSHVFEGVSLKEYGKKREKVKFDLDFTFNETDEDLYLILGFSTELFYSETAQRILDHYEILLKKLLANDSESVSQVNFLTKTEETEQLQEFNQTDFPFDKEKTIYDLIENQISENNHKKAIVFGSKTLDYQELDSKANQLAQRLEKVGVQKNDIVPIIMSRGIDYVVACLAIMKVGGAFAPISKSLPFERAKQIIEEIKPKTILLNNDTIDQFGIISSNTELIDTNKLNQKADFIVKNRLTPNDLMYVIYTSGSTGKPKGVMVPHKGIFNRFMWMNLYFGKESAQSVARTTKHIYDSSVWQLFWPLSLGGKTVIPEEDFDGNTNYLFDLIEKNQITIIDFVPSMFEEVVENIETNGSKIQSLKSVILGGETINLKTTQHFIKSFPKIHVTNLYGPTEASIGCIAHRVEPTDTTIVPIGSPISNVRVLILDENKSLIPKGHVGEICLSGICLADGYLFDNQRTNQVFVENPYGSEDYARMYKTGDLGRWLPNGKIEFLGRKDNQVKIRGHRVELGEIENTLLSHSLIKEACVVIQNSDSSPQLVAFVVEEPSKTPLIIDQVNQTDVDFPKEKTFDDLFKESVSKWADRVAVSDSKTSFSYSQLNKKVNLLAQKLIENNIKKGEIIPVCFERSIEMLISILAIFRVGGVYVPIPTNTPLSRIKEILDDCEAKVILVKNGETPVDINRNIKRIEISEIEQEESDEITINLLPTDLAYIIFTSGSTGKPKGVMIEHIGMINHLFAKINDLNLDESSNVVQNSSQGFDISIWQFLSALLVGGSTTIFEESVVKNPLNFVEKIQQTQPTILEVVPTYLGVLLDLYETILPTAKPSIKYVLVTGEILKKSLVERWFARFESIKLVNAYGPTEASDDITHFVMSEVPTHEQIPIGKPIQNFKIYIVNEFGKLVDVNEKGEIWVSGVGVGRGYLKNSQKTAEVFGEDNFREKNGVRLYRTGDIGCFLPDGNIAFFGRIDNQVKLRGYRIELTEIEHHLTQITGVKDAVVVKKEDSRQNQYLHAFLLSDKKDIDLKDLLKKSIPEYMIPQEFSFYDAFPVTSNGKVDRKALAGEITKDENDEIKTKNLSKEIKEFLKTRLPDFMIPNQIIKINKLPMAKTGKIDRKYLASISLENQEKTTKVQPKTKIEEKLLSIWQEILQKTEISAIDNFFEIGGHSLKATRLISAIDKAFQTKIGLKEIFQNPTIQTLALIIEKSNNKFDLIEKIAQNETYELSNAQRRLWLLHQIDDAKSVYNLPGLFLINGKLDREVVEKTFMEIIRRHESLRTAFEMTENQPRQRVIPFEALNWSIKFQNLSNQADAFACCQRLAFEDNKIPFDLSKAPLLRIKLFQISATKYVLSFNIHHIISDEWSFGVLVKEFLMIYKILSEKAEILLPELHIQYKDYAFWKNQQTQTPQYLSSKNYWSQQFSGVVPVLNLPTSKPRLQVQTYKGQNQTILIDKAITQKYLAINQRENTTLFMNLVASLNVLFNQFTNQTDITIGTPMAGREHPDLENQIGFFVNTVPIRSQFKQDFSYNHLLNIVRSNILAAYEHQHYPFDKIVDELTIQKDPSRSPLFDVMIVLEDEGVVHKFNTFDQKDFSIANISLEIPFSKFDLTFYFKQVDEKLQIHLNYNTDLFEKAWIDNLLNRLNFIIGRVADDSTIKICQIGISSTEKQRLDEWNELPSYELIDFINPLSINQCLSRTKILRDDHAVGIGIEGELFVDSPEGHNFQKLDSNLTKTPKNWSSTNIIAKYDFLGNIILVGSQSKKISHNGYEIHLDWIEKVGLSHPLIKSIRVFFQGEKLVASIESDSEIDLVELREVFRSKLPSYQIPTEFVLENKDQMIKNSLQKTNEENLIIEVFEHILAKTELSKTDNFFDLGGDSIKAIQIITALYQRGYKVDYQDIFTYPNIYELAFALKPIQSRKQLAFKESEIVLTPIQERLFEAGFENAQAFSMAMVVKSRKSLEPVVLQTAISELYKYHDGLRMKFWQENEGFKQFNFESAELPILETLQLDTYEPPIHFLQTKKQQLTEQISLEKGDLIKIALCQTENGDYLLLVANHLIIDGISWVILLEDLMKAYNQIKGNQKVDLGIKSSSVYEWNNRMGFEYDFNKEIEFWEKNSTQNSNLKNQFGIKKTLKTKISVKDTLSLRGMKNVGYGNSEKEILIASLLRSLSKSEEINEFGIMIEAHGRNQLIEDLDLTRTIGWFTSVFPFRINPSDNIQNDLLNTKQALAQLPNDGIGYGWLKYFHQKIKGNEPNILFNFLGNLDEQFTDSSIEFVDLPIQNQSYSQFMQFPVVVSCWIFGGELNLEIAYNSDIFKNRSINQLLTYWKNTILEIIEWGAEQNERIFMPSDFSYTNISIKEFENIFE